MGPSPCLARGTDATRRVDFTDDALAHKSGLHGSLFHDSNEFMARHSVKAHIASY